MSTAAISATQLADLHRQGRKLDLIDVRTASEFREAHVSFAKNMPLDRLDVTELTRLRHGSSDEPLYVICQKGGRGNTACAQLAAAGLHNVVNVEGGTSAALATALPITRGPKAISLERQVRIAAGSLVLLGVALSYTVHPYCIGLSAFVGAGLVFAGVTDTCGMAMILARMPWNK